MAHTDVLRTLADSTLQRNFDHLFAIIAVFDGAKKGDFFKWMEWLESVCLLSRYDICSKALRKVIGDVRTCLIGLPMTLLWNSVYQELKGCFPSLSTATHVTKSLNIIMQKPHQSLHNQVYYVALDKTNHESMDLMRIYHFVASTNNTTIANMVLNKCGMPRECNKVHLKRL